MAAKPAKRPAKRPAKKAAKKPTPQGMAVGAGNSAGVRKSRLAELFSCSPRTIQDLEDKGLVIKLRRGYFDEDASITNYVKHLREKAAGRQGEDGKIDVVAEGALLKRVQREEVELRIAKLKGSLIELADVEPTWERIVMVVRQHVLRIPSLARQRISTLTGQDAKILDELVRSVLEEASNDEAAL